MELQTISQMSKTFNLSRDTVKGVCGWLEEHLNYWNWNKKERESEKQLDLLMPVKLRLTDETNHEDNT